MTLNRNNSRQKSDRKQLLMLSGLLLAIVAVGAVCTELSSGQSKSQTAGPAVQKQDTVSQSAAGTESPKPEASSGKDAGAAGSSKAGDGSQEMIVLTDGKSAAASSDDLTITAAESEEKPSQAIVVQTDGLKGDNALCDLGLAYERGTGGHAVDYARAAYWYAKGVKEGSTCAMNSLGYMYMEGAGVQKDYSSAFSLFLLSAEKGDAEGAFAAGYMTERGWGTDYDVRKAFGFYAMAAEKGYAPAENAVGTMFESGAGVDKSYEKAFKWYELAARDGDVNGIYNLADKYRQGKGTAQNNEKALELFGQAARMGNAYAQYDYGSMLAAGLGTEKNLVEAYAWLKISTDTLKQGEGILGAVSYLMSKDDLAKAERLAEDYRKKYKSLASSAAVSLSDAPASDKISRTYPKKN